MYLTKKRTGSVTALMLVVIIILTITGISSLNIAFQTRLRTIRTAQKLAARAAADAGLTKALYHMNEQLKTKPWNDSPLPETFDEALPEWAATFSYIVTGDEAGGYTVQSTGDYSSTQKTVQGKLKLASAFDFAIFGDESVNFKAKANVNWINFDPSDNFLKVATNSTETATITIYNASEINGDVAAGVGGNTSNVIKNLGGTVTGKTCTLSERFDMSPVYTPSSLTSLPSSGSITSTTTITSSGKYSKIDLGNNEKVAIQGNIELHVTGDIILGNGAEFDIETGSSLTLYIDGDIEAKYGSDFNNETSDATKFKIYGGSSSQNFTFKNSSVFYGAIYAPKADVRFDNSADAYGSVICENFEQKNSSDFYYDAALRDVSYNDTATRFTFSQWQEL